ncbi:OmpA family protein [Actinoplanes rectilineatus]|uniref:OmpA family protein n=1 Tax=Actinoplanes rectilineatus TaxID=113571 RepID=UPI000B2C0E1B|nr:OmpA family protein [Actinoplanes rectilineatus]
MSDSVNTTDSVNTIDAVNMTDSVNMTGAVNTSGTNGTSSTSSTNGTSSTRFVGGKGYEGSLGGGLTSKNSGKAATAGPGVAVRGKRRWGSLVAIVIGLALILGLQLVPNRHRIEDDLTSRASAALATAGQSGSTVSFTGRDGLVVAGTSADAERAREIVEDVTGVRTVDIRVGTGQDNTDDGTDDGANGDANIDNNTDNNTDAGNSTDDGAGEDVDGGESAGELPAPGPASSLVVEVRGGRAVMTGVVPSSADRAAMAAAVTAALGARAVDDRVAVAKDLSGGSALDRLPAILRALPDGGDGLSVRLENNVVLLAGVAPTAAAHAALAEAAAKSGVTVVDAMTVADLQTQFDSVPAPAFRTNSSALTPESRDGLRELADLLEANPDARIRIGGHTDSRGAAAMNKALSEKRAESVAAGLRKLGVDRERLTVVGYGEAHPKVPNDTAAHRAVNRRVELTVTTS